MSLTVRVDDADQQFAQRAAEFAGISVAELVSRALVVVSHGAILTAELDFLAEQRARLAEQQAALRADAEALDDMRRRFARAVESRERAPLTSTNEDGN